MKKRTYLGILVSIILVSFVVLGVFKVFRIGTPSPIIQKLLPFEERIAITDVIFENLTKVSPDQKYTLYVTSNSLSMQHSKLWVVDNETQEELLLAEDKVFSYVTNPLWTMDSKQVIYAKIFPFELFKINIDGTDKSIVYSQKEQKAKNKFFPSIGFGGEMNLSIENDEVIFENNYSIPKSNYAVDINSKKLRKLEGGEFIDVRQDIDLKVPHLSQRTAAFAKERIGTCKGETIGSAGCAVAAAAMVAKFYENDVGTSELNKLLTTNDVGYFDGCYIRWNMISNLFPNIKLKGAFFGDSNKKRLDYELSLGNPVVVGFDKVSFNDFQHWVVVSGRKTEINPITGEFETKYLVQDPWSTEPVERYLEYFGKGFNHMVVYEKVSK